MADHRNPLSVVIPHQFHNHTDYPTEVVAQRFQAYRDIVKDLIAYLRQYASVQEEILRQQARLQQAVGAPTAAPAGPGNASSSRSTHLRTREKEVVDDDLSAINQYFLPIGNGSIQDIPTVLTKFHQQNIHNGTKTLKEINTLIIPKLEDLRKDLLVKVKEIKNLQNDFKNTLGKEMLETKLLLASFNHAIDVANRLEILGSASDLHAESHELDSAKKDPYLAKLRLDRQLRRQLSEENYLYEAYKNLQTSSERLESIVVLEIQNYFRLFLELVEIEHSSVPNFLVPSLTNGFLAKESTFEWESFVTRNLPTISSISNNLSSGKFIDLSFPSRKLSDLNIPHFDSLVNYAVRDGTLERRSKFLKSYSSGYYVLTCSYLHEFKTADRKKDQTPVMSLSLDYCLVSEHSKNDGKLSGTYKFVLYSKLPNGLIHRSHNWVFRCSTYQSMIDWYNDLKTLTSLASPAARAKAMSKKLQSRNALTDKRLSRTSTVLSAQSGTRSLKSNAASSRLALSPKVTNNSVGVNSQNISVASSGQNHRLSSTFSLKFHQSPKLSNLINSDGTIVTPVETNVDKGTNSVDPNGDLMVDTTLTENGADSSHAEQPKQEAPEAGVAPITFAVQNGSMVLPAQQSTPQQITPQNYQYHVKQVSPQPQQFYDPVTHQFFTINAIPALQVSQIDAQMHQQQQQQQQQQNQTQLTPTQQPPQQPQAQYLTAQPASANQSQPMPQYFPSSPQPNQSQYIQGSSMYQPQIIRTSPQINQGQFFAVPGENGKHQNIPHFPNSPNDSSSGHTPYPVQLGEGLGARQNSTASQEQVKQSKRIEIPDDQVSKLTITDESERK